MRHALFVVVGVALAGCLDFGVSPDLGGTTNWKKGESHHTVWSENDSAFAYQWNKYEYFTDMWGSGSKDHSYALFVRGRHETSLRQVLKRRAGKAELLYYMRGEGYLVVQLWEHENYVNMMSPPPEKERAFARVSMDGKVVTLTRGSWYEYDVVPSPDGKLLAEVHYASAECHASYPYDEHGTRKYPCAIHLKFLRAGDLAVESSDTVVFMLGWDSNSSGSFHARPGAVWSPEGDFYLTNIHEAVRKRSGQPFTWEEPRACRIPKTSSDWISSNWEAVRHIGDGNFEFYTVPSFIPLFGEQQTFGCPPEEE